MRFTKQFVVQCVLTYYLLLIHTANCAAENSEWDSSHHQSTTSKKRPQQDNELLKAMPLTERYRHNASLLMTRRKLAQSDPCADYVDPLRRCYQSYRAAGGNKTCTLECSQVLVGQYAAPVACQTQFKQNLTATFLSEGNPRCYPICGLRIGHAPFCDCEDWYLGTGIREQKGYPGYSCDEEIKAAVVKPDFTYVCSTQCRSFLNTAAEGCKDWFNMVLNLMLLDIGIESPFSVCGIEASKNKVAPINVQSPSPSPVYPKNSPPSHVVYRYPPPSPPSDDGGSSSSIGAIIGGIVVGIALITIGVGLFLWWRQRKAKATAANTPLPTHNSPEAELGKGFAVSPRYSPQTKPDQALLTSTGGYSSTSRFTQSIVSNSELSRDPLLSWIVALQSRASNASATTQTSSGTGIMITGRSGSSGSTSLYKVIGMGEIEMVRNIGEGSFGSVYLGHWSQTPVAVKVLVDARALGTANFANTLTRLSADLEKEASLMASLRHPNIVQFMGVCLDPPAIITEWCSRGSLTSVLQQGNTSVQTAAELSWKRRLLLAVGMARGMLYLHSNKPAPILHRDLKSPNILVDEHWNAKVADFNLSKLLLDTLPLDAGGGAESSLATTLGATNPRWLAPEVVSGSPHSIASDVYSFGVVMWEMLTWSIPWVNMPQVWGIAAAIQAGQRPPIPTIDTVKGGPVPFDEYQQYVSIMERCWAQEPSHRPGFDQITSELNSLHRKK